MASSLDSAAPWETIKMKLSFTHFSSQTEGRVPDHHPNLCLLAFAFAELSSQVPFLPMGLLASACSMSPLRAFPDSHPNQFPKELTHGGVITCSHIFHQTRLQLPQGNVCSCSTWPEPRTAPRPVRACKTWVALG